LFPRKKSKKTVERTLATGKMESEIGTSLTEDEIKETLGPLKPGADFLFAVDPGNPELEKKLQEYLNNVAKGKDAVFPDEFYRAENEPKAPTAVEPDDEDVEEIFVNATGTAFETSSAPSPPPAQAPTALSDTEGSFKVTIVDERGGNSSDDGEEEYMVRVTQEDVDEEANFQEAFQFEDNKMPRPPPKPETLEILSPALSTERYLEARQVLKKAYNEQVVNKGKTKELLSLEKKKKTLEGTLKLKKPTEPADDATEDDFEAYEIAYDRYKKNIKKAKDELPIVEAAIQKEKKCH